MMKFKTSGVALAVIAAFSSVPVFAAENSAAENSAADDIEVIQVTGIKGSLVQSLNNKRFESSIVDGISAEDLGKFPDQNVAESLQRITGVTIDRSGGEGRRISIRGFGPQFNTVLYNQRTLPTDDGGRAFSFDMVASELISGADVFKTSSAHMQEGGIGGTVNMKSAKPLQYDGFKAAASAKAVTDTLADSTTPYISGILSNNFNDEFGVLASIAYQQRDARQDSASVGGYRSDNVTQGSEPFGPKTTDKFWRPQSAAQTYTVQDRERIGGTLALQWRPSDELEITLDGLYSRLDVDDTSSQLSRWFSPPMFNAQIDANNTVTSFDRVPKPQVEPGVYQLYKDGSSIGIGQWNSSNLISRDRISTTRMVGLNIDWQATDDVNVTFDVQSSASKGRSENNPAFTLAVPTQANTSFALQGDTFSWSGSDAEFNGSSSDYVANNLTLFSDNADDDVTEARADMKWSVEDLGMLTSINAGVYYSDREKRSNRFETLWNPVVTGFRGFYINVPSSVLTSVSPKGGFLSDHDQGGFVNSWLSYNPQDVINYLMSDDVKANAEHKKLQILNNYANGDPKYAGMSQAEVEEIANAAEAKQLATIEAAQAAGFTPQHRADKSWVVEEETIAAYIAADFETEVAGMALTGNVGLRYIETDLSSQGNGSTFEGLRYDTADNSASAVTKKGEDVTASSSYSELLPSLNLKLDVTEDVVARFSYSETLTRPKLSDLSPRVSIANTSLAVTDFDNIDFVGQISGDNPNLKPYTSTNYDLALEWYYSDDSYLGATAFHKEIENWITTITRTVQLPDALNGGVLRNFEQKSPFNNESADASGLELSALHSFDNGFGVQVNYTYMDSSAEFDVNKENLTFALDGLSKNSYNVVAFYEEGPLQARIAYNWRDEFTECAACSRSSQPVMVEDYGQVDASFSYDIDENFSVFADVINLTDADIRKYTTYKSRFLSLSDTGRRFSIGVRATF